MFGGSREDKAKIGRHSRETILPVYCLLTVRSWRLYPIMKK